MTKVRKHLDIIEIYRELLRGASISELSRKHQVARGTIRQHILWFDKQLDNLRNTGKVDSGLPYGNEAIEHYNRGMLLHPDKYKSFFRWLADKFFRRAGGGSRP